MSPSSDFTPTGNAGFMAGLPTVSPSTDRPRHFWIVAGEVSGDLHGAELVHQLKELQPGCRFSGIGGQRLAAEGVRLFHGLDELAVMGFSEVLGKLTSIIKLFRGLVRRLREERPDALILVDFPDFNLRLAKKAHRLGIPVIYFISPQLWAWRRGRIRIVKRYVRRMIVIFPFEREFYQQHGVDVSFSGYPLCEKLDRQRYAAAETRRELAGREGGLLIGLLPGSRSAEIARNLPSMLGAASILRSRNENISFVLPRAATVKQAQIDAILAENDVEVTVLDGRAYEVMANADLLMVTSGTATLEAACLGTPMIVIYRMSLISYLIARFLVKVPFIAMANLVAGKPVVPELIQRRARDVELAETATKLLGTGQLQAMRHELEAVRSRLMTNDAYRNAAKSVLEALEE